MAPTAPPPKKPAVKAQAPVKVQVWQDIRERIDARKAALSSRGKNRFAKYRNDPVAFIRRELGEQVTPDVIKLCRSFVENPSTVARSANATGKTHAAARLAVWYFLVWDDAKVFTAAAPPEDNLKRLLWGEIGGIVWRHPHLFEGMKVSLAGLHIERHPESFLTGVTIPVSADPKTIEGRFSGKHAPHMAFFFDEADAIPLAVFKGTESCMSGGHTRQLCMFNPRQQGGEPYLIEKEGRGKVVELTAFNHPNVRSGKDLYPGAVTRETTCRRINMWCRPLVSGEKPDKECFLLPEFLEGYVAKRQDGEAYPPLRPGWYRVVVSEFSYMVLGRYPAMAENQLISEAWIDAATSRWEAWHARMGGGIVPKGVRPISGQDVGELGTDSSTNYLRYGCYVSEPEEWQGVDVDITAERAATRCINANAQYCNVDANGVGAGVPPAMKRHYGFKNAYRIMVATAAPESENADPDEAQCELVRDLMLWKLREWLRTDPNAMIPPVQKLKEEMLALQYSYNNRKKVKVTDTATIREKIGRSPDHLMGLALTFAPKGDSVSKAKSESYLGENRPKEFKKLGYKEGKAA